MSAPEMQRGLLANCVAARVQALADPKHRELIWWLQRVSWQPGGMDTLVAEMLQWWPERFTTRTMQRLGVDRDYSAAEVREIRGPFRADFPVRGDKSEYWGSVIDTAEAWDSGLEKHRRAMAELPETYPASAFAKACRQEAAEELAEFLLESLCLNPSIQMDDRALWYLPQLAETLADLLAIRAASAATAAPTTEIGAQINETLDYALSERCFVVIDGLARDRKSVV